MTNREKAMRIDIMTYMSLQMIILQKVQVEMITEEQAGLEIKDITKFFVEGDSESLVMKMANDGKMLGLWSDDDFY